MAGFDTKTWFWFPLWTQGLNMCWRNRRWKQNTTTLSFLDVILIYDHILLCELERCGKEPSWFPPCVLSTPVMLKILLVFQAGMSNVVWTVWLWQSNGTCLHFEVDKKWLRLFLQGLSNPDFSFFLLLFNWKRLEGRRVGEEVGLLGRRKMNCQD